ncbi:membrane protein insertase YidC [Bailinhaonella thermotolerans]|uniref:Membrane protein insertase YidC n=1 Tax=Bailinhaonella thermotolerans TaxID=1070861 RepID=A0A3A4BMA0_9ACTN|nr:membrane protein insertase YidC [Bailinhaonella thermotolerans]RJL32152.1 membrane protein insertase YidC [Bailinhaonella thermotolerans]
MEFAWLNWLYEIVAWVLIKIHEGYSTFIAPSSGLNWALTIITLTVLMRLLIFPLVLKQLHSSRKMQELAPQIQKIREKYKHDKQRMSQETMKVYQEAGANPLGGCLPLLAQMPVFFSMFAVLNAIAGGKAKFGMSQEMVDSAQKAHILGVPVPATFLTDNSVLTGTMHVGNPILAKAVLFCFVLVSSLTTFLTVRQSVKRSIAQMPDNPMAQQQKILMYISPLFAFFSLGFPLGLILYWVTTNVWSLAQQHWVYSKYPPPGADGKPQPKKPGMMAKFRKQPPQDTAPPAPPEPKITRQQPRQQPRSKRTGGKKR